MQAQNYDHYASSLILVKEKYLKKINALTTNQTNRVAKLVMNEVIQFQSTKNRDLFLVSILILFILINVLTM